MDNINDFCGLSPQLVIPTTFEECFTYEEQILYLKQLIEDSEGADLTEIEQRLSAVEASVANLNDEVAEINVDDIKAQLQTINAELTELKNKSSTQADSITALQSTVTTQGTEISAVKRQVETQATTVTNLSNSLSTTNNNVTTNTNNIATNTANIASLNQNLSGVSADVNRLNDELTETQTTLAGKQNALTFDNTPTTGSNNPVTSDGISKALAGKQNTLTFDNTPTAGSNNPVTSDGIRTAIDEAGGGGTTTVEWVETNMDEFKASLPANVTYTTDLNLDDINNDNGSLVPLDMIWGTFTQTGMFISSDKRYLKVVWNVTDATVGSSSYDHTSYSSPVNNPQRAFTYCVYYVTIKQEHSNFMFTNDLYSISRGYGDVVSTIRCNIAGGIQGNSVATCNVYYKLIPELPIELT